MWLFLHNGPVKCRYEFLVRRCTDLIPTLLIPEVNLRMFMEQTFMSESEIKNLAILKIQ